MKASVFPGSSGEPLFLNLILCKRRVKLSFPIMGSTGGHGVSAKRSVKKRSVRFPDTPLSVLRGDLALADPVETAELLQVSGGTDQHDLGESSGAEVPKARHLLTCADAGVDHGRLGLPVVGACLPLFLKTSRIPPQVCAAASSRNSSMAATVRACCSSAEIVAGRSPFWGP